MAKYNLLIIDDDLENREQGYTTVLGHDYFDYEFIKSGDGKELEKIKSANVHGFVLDMNLSKWTNGKPEDLFRVVADLIGKRGPVFLISNMWNQDMIRWVNKSKSIINIVYYISWDNDIKIFLENQSNVGYIPIRENIKSELDNHYELESTVLDVNEKIRILHISDLQFGDKLRSNDSVFLEKLIPKYLGQVGISINLIVASGDIAYSGIPSEYELAEKWFNTFCVEILGVNFKSRLLLIPGNHDVNLRLNAADKYKYDFKAKKLMELEITLSKEHHFYGLTPFREFAYKMTDNPMWMTNQNHLCFVNDRFHNWGLRFYHFNSVIEQWYDEPDKAGIPEENLKQMMSAPKIQEDIFKIIISHHGPDNFGYKPNDVSDKRWLDIRNFIEYVGPQLFLHGHTHGFETYTLREKGNENRSIKYHMTSTLSLEKQARLKDALRGFSVIELERENGIVKKETVVIRDFEIEEAQISERKKK